MSLLLCDCCDRQMGMMCSDEPEPIKDWSLTSLKERLIKIGAKVVSHGRYVAFQMAEVAIPWKPLCRHSADDRGTAAATRCIDSVMRSIVMRSMQSVGKVRLDDGKHTFFVAQRGVGLPRRPSTSCCGDSRLPGTPVRDNIRLKSAAIRRMSVKTISSDEI